MTPDICETVTFPPIARSAVPPLPVVTGTVVVAVGVCDGAVVGIGEVVGIGVDVDVGDWEGEGDGVGLPVGVGEVGLGVGVGVTVTEAVTTEGVD